MVINSFLVGSLGAGCCGWSSLASMRSSRSRIMRVALSIAIVSLLDFQVANLVSQVAVELFLVTQLRRACHYLGLSRLQHAVDVLHVNRGQHQRRAPVNQPLGVGPN